MRRGASRGDIAIALCVAMLAACAAGDDSPLCGYRPPPNARSVRSAKSETAARRLRYTEIPSAWDSRKHGWITPVKDQAPWGTCWTFAAFATLETQLLKSGRGEWDFSEKNMASLNGFDVYFDNGGNYDMASAYLLRWGGAVMESNDVYRVDISAWNGHPSVPMNPAMRVQNVVWVPGRQYFTDNDTLKTAIMEYGAVAVSYYHEDAYCTSTGAYYCNADTNDNHAVTVVGWDDNYSKYKFSRRPPGDGACIVKNSWGTAYGDEGYLYISYYDVQFAKADGVVYIPAAENEDYTAVYGYDKLGVVETDEDSDYSLVAAAFTSAWNEELAAVGVYALEAPKPYTLSIYTNVQRGASSPVSGGVLARIQSGTIERTGYTTIHLEEPVALADGSNFSVVYAPGGTTRDHCVCKSWSGYSSCSPQKGNTYFASTYNDSGATVTNWIDAVEHPVGASIACLKAYTRTTRTAEDEACAFRRRRRRAWRPRHDQCRRLRAVRRIVRSFRQSCGRERPHALDELARRVRSVRSVGQCPFALYRHDWRQPLAVLVARSWSRSFLYDLGPRRAFSNGHVGHCAADGAGDNVRKVLQGVGWAKRRALTDHRRRRREDARVSTAAPIDCFRCGEFWSLGG